MKSLKKVMRLSKEEKYLLTCSFGPDSMALFYYLLKHGFTFEVVHVNYHILEQADDDEKGIREFAEKYNIKVHVLETYMPKNVNEEIWAREVRYNYFEKVAKERNINKVLVAHNKGDNIETYLLQKERGGVFYHYGLEKISKRGNVKIVRPLLNITKNELEEYCKNNNVPFSIDPSNFDSKFKRNKIRKDLKKLNDNEINNILIEIKAKNLQNLSIFTKFKRLGIPNFINCYNKLFKELKVEEFQLLLIALLKKKDVFMPISKGRVENLLSVINNKPATYKEKIKDDYLLYFDYGIIQIIKKPKRYTYEFENINETNEIFRFNKEADNIDLILNSFPLTIKPAIEGKTFKVKGHTLKVNREFIYWKMPSYLREVRPGIFDKNGNLIYVPRYQKKIKKNGLLSFKCSQLLCWQIIKQFNWKKVNVFYN